MFQDTSLNCQGSQTSGPRNPASPFPSLVVFPPEIDNPAHGEHQPLDWVETLAVDDDKGFTENCGGSMLRAPEMSVNPYCNIQGLPYQQELYFGLSSPTWSTTESDFSSPAYTGTLPRTPVTLHPTPVLGIPHLHPNHTSPNAPAQQFGGELSMFSPAHSPWAVPATISSPATVVTDASARNVTRDMHATRYEHHPPSQPRLPSSFGIPIASPAYGSQETGLQLTLHQPAALRADGSAHHLMSYGSATGDDAALESSYSFIPYGADGHFNGTMVAAENEDTKDGMQYMSASTKPAKKKPFACSHCSRAFARTQDLTRHMKTVHGEGKQWVCCGVPVSEEHNYKISADAIRIGPMEHEGVLMIGGCGREFGRKDTYAKHLKSVRTRCVGDVDALYHSENMKKVLRFRMARASRK
ncbi:hypothetical protein V8D89_014858 [Ganoderma adspersum]